MSSRALRKAQKEREALELRKKAGEEVDESDEDVEIPRTSAKPSVFALLNLEEEEEDTEEPSEEPTEQPIQTLVDS